MKYYFTQFLILKNLFEIYIPVYLTSYWESIVVEILETVEQEHSMGIHDNVLMDCNSRKELKRPLSSVKTTERSEVLSSW